jgi:pilus assembly protein CpaF
MQDIFRFEEQGEEEGKVIGRLKPVGIRPNFTNQLAVHGFELPPAMFMDMEKAATPLDNNRRGKRGRA